MDRSAPTPTDASTRHVALPDGRALTIRRVGSADVGGLQALYDGLDDEARHRRFFSAYRPPPSFFERLVAVEERGGSGLVAVVTDADGHERIVAEAAYEMLPNGNAELAITVDRSWRGWLGPYLLDALVERAAACGVPNLEADILVTNAPMLALVRARGLASLPSDDWTVARVVIGASDRTPTWPATRHGTRLLVEGSGGHWRGQDAARIEGFEVLCCPGPAAGQRHCPAVLGRPCPLAMDADAVVVANATGDAGWHDLRAAHGVVHAGVPICVERVPDGESLLAGEIDGQGRAPAGVIALVQRAIEARHDSDPKD